MAFAINIILLNISLRSSSWIVLPMYTSVHFTDSGMMSSYLTHFDWTLVKGTIYGFSFNFLQVVIQLSQYQLLKRLYSISCSWHSLSKISCPYTRGFIIACSILNNRFERLFLLQYYAVLIIMAL